MIDRNTETLAKSAGRFRSPDGAEIHFQIIGQTGPWVAVISGGRFSLTELKGFAKKIAARGYRVVIHDRRNCGESSLDFDNLLPEDDFWADDLAALLSHLKAQPAFVVGRSRGARVALRLNQRHPGSVQQLMLWGLTGGQTTVRLLDEYYYGQYLRAGRAGGLAAVCAMGHFAELIATRPENQSLLLAIDPIKFLSTLTRWRDAFLAGSDQPIMGVSPDDLQQIDVPTSIVRYYDRLHPHTAALHAHQLISNSRFFDFDPSRQTKSMIKTFLHWPGLKRRLRRIAGETVWRTIRSRWQPRAQLERDEDAVAAILCDIYKMS